MSSVQADEFDWVYFPMYNNDSAHSVHLSHLKFRPDGLLRSASRYPRTSDEQWPEDISKVAWYGYEERLIDCETGFFVETSSSLLAQDGKRLISRPAEHKAQVARLEAQLTKNSRSWPTQSEIFLACAAASNAKFRQKRAAQAAKPIPLFSDRSLVDILAEDTETLWAMKTMRFDFSRIGKKPSAPASALFDDMRAQYGQWRKNAFNVSVTARPADARRDKAALAAMKARIKELGASVQLRSVKGSVIEIDAMHDEGDYYADGDAARVTMWTTRSDCARGVSVPVAQYKMARRGKAGASKPLTVKAVLKDVMEQYGRSPEEPGRFGGPELEQVADAVCTLLDAPAPSKNPDLAADAVEENAETALPMAFGMKLETIAKQKDAAAMLLAIRAASRRAGRQEAQ